MKKPGEDLKKGSGGRGIVGAALIAQFALFSPLATAINLATDPGVTGASSPHVSSTGQFSPGIGDILKMVDAKVDAAVIQAYIKNSAVAYSPSVNEIIALKGRGVSDDILTALLERGAEIRDQIRAGAPAPTASYGTAPAYATQPAYPYAEAYPQYAYDYPSYYPYSYPYYYPDSYNYGYAYGYPWFWGSSFGFDFCPFQPFGFCSFHHQFHHSHGSHSAHNGHGHDGHGGLHASGPGQSGHGNFGSHASVNQPIRSGNLNTPLHASGGAGRSFSRPSQAGFRSANLNMPIRASTMSGRSVSMPGHMGGFHSSAGGSFRSGGGGFHGGGAYHGGGGFHGGGAYHGGGGFHGGGGGSMRGGGGHGGGAGRGR